MNQHNITKYPKIVELDFSGHNPPAFVQLTEAEFSTIKKIAKKNNGYIYGDAEAEKICFADEGGVKEDRLVFREDVNVPLKEILTVIAYE